MLPCYHRFFCRWCALQVFHEPRALTIRMLACMNGDQEVCRKSVINTYTYRCNTCIYLDCFLVHRLVHVLARNAHYLTHVHRLEIVHPSKRVPTSKLCTYALLSLCAASRMWVRHRSVVIVPPEGDLEFWWDSEMCWCFIHVTIKLVSGTTRRSVIESCITHVSSSPRETVLREICFLVDLDRRKKMRRVCLLDSRCVFLSFSSGYEIDFLFIT